MCCSANYVGHVSPAVSERLATVDAGDAKRNQGLVSRVQVEGLGVLDVWNGGLGV